MRDIFDNAYGAMYYFSYNLSSQSSKPTIKQFQQMNPTTQSPSLKLTAPQMKPDEFYQLHYPQKQDTKASPHQSRFRAKSVLSVTQKQNPQLLARNSRRKKLSQEDRVGQVSQLIQKQKQEKTKLEVFSFKSALSGRHERGYVGQYMAKYPSNYFGTIEDVAKQNAGVRQALQKCKDEKIKVAKVLGSQRQPEHTKLDYLQLKQQEIREERRVQLRQIYDQFFRKEYEQLYGEAAFSEFSHRMEETVALVHAQMFGSI